MKTLSEKCIDMYNAGDSIDTIVSTLKLTKRIVQMYLYEGGVTTSDIKCSGFEIRFKEDWENMQKKFACFPISFLQNIKLVPQLKDNSKDSVKT